MLPPRLKTHLLNALAFVPFLLYVGFVVITDRGPVDYETFLEIGSRVAQGQPIFTGNSYYPFPYVYIFTLLYWLPRPVSLVLWLLGPVLAAWLIAKRKPWVLVFGPLAAHFFGGQSAVFAMLGLWGYLRHRDANRWTGGLWLGLIALKPHLVIFPALYAARDWWLAFRASRRLPRQMLAFCGVVAAGYLSGVPFGWDWPVQWLTNPRPVFYRAQAGIIPRTLVLLGADPTALYFWGLTLGLLGLLLWAAWRLNRGQMPLALWLFCAACGFPFIHDYDLIQLIPLLDNRPLQRWALLASIPLWVVMLAAYQNDAAWYAVTLIPPVLVGAFLWHNRGGFKKESRPR